MVSPELNFGRVLHKIERDLQLPADEALEFANVVDTQTKLLVSYWYSTSEECQSTSEDAVAILDLIRLGEKIEQADAEFIIDVVENLMWELDIGDEDDAFGTEGWRHILGWD